MKFLLLAQIVGVLTPAFGQASGIPGTASRTINLAPEEAAFSLTVYGKPDTQMEDVLKVVAELGLGIQDLTVTGSARSFVPSPTGGVQEVTSPYFGFETVVPFARSNEFRQRIAALKDIPEGISLGHEVAVRPARRTIEAASQRLWPELVAEARAKAQALASAGGIRLGPLRSVNDYVSEYYSHSGSAFAAPLTSNRLRYSFFVTVVYAIAE